MILQVFFARLQQVNIGSETSFRAVAKLVITATLNNVKAIIDEAKYTQLSYTHTDQHTTYTHTLTTSVAKLEQRRRPD